MKILIGLSSNICAIYPPNNLHLMALSLAKVIVAAELSVLKPNFVCYTTLFAVLVPEQRQRYSALGKRFVFAPDLNTKGGEKRW